MVGEKKGGRDGEGKDHSNSKQDRKKYRWPQQWVSNAFCFILVVAKPVFHYIADQIGWGGLQ